MGEVWRATDLVLDRLVAVKLLRPAYAEDEEHLARFRAEARHAGSLSHPGIAQVYDYREADPPHPPYLVMELVDGPPLTALLGDGPVDPARTMGLIAQAARALQAAHAAGLVHRDIKPGNLLLSQSGLLKITDFGIAHATGSAPLTRPGALVGTPAYLAPERTAGAPAMPAADLYALGIVAFQCLTGELPFNGEPLAVALAHQEQPLPPLPPWVPADVAALVADLAAKDPRARPASAGEVAERAERVRTTLTVTATRRLASHGGRLTGIRGRAALAAAAITAVAAAGWLLTGAHGPMSARSQPSPPAAGRQSTAPASHPANRVEPAVGAGITITTGAHARARRPAASHESPAAHVTPGETPAPATSGTPAPGGAPTPSGTPAPSGTPTASGTPSPSETATPAPAS
jgi:serine/threonine-protein kinase